MLSEAETQQKLNFFSDFIFFQTPLSLSGQPLMLSYSRLQICRDGNLSRDPSSLRSIRITKKTINDEGSWLIAHSSNFSLSRLFVEVYNLNLNL